ncbi:MAG: response regulator transcription factor [Myxococcota bacterium]
MIRVVVADDQDLVREGLVAIIDRDPALQVVGTARDGVHAVERVRALRPDVVVMDVRMPNLDGITATRIICRDVPTCRVLVLTTFDLDTQVVEARQAGASHYLLKDATPDTFRSAIHTLAAQDLPRRLPDGPERLTPREAEVLELIGEGFNNLEIAERLFVSTSTIKTHINRILAKLSLRDRVQAVIYAYENGLVPSKRRT